MHKTIKVLVVDDSALMRKVVSDILCRDSRIEVAGTAKNGREAKEMVASLHPDVVTMDVEMPIMNGLQAVREIMEQSPVPIIMLSTLTQTGAKETIEALEYGALDFVTKPGGMADLHSAAFADDLHAKVVAASKAHSHRGRTFHVAAPSLLRRSETSSLHKDRHSFKAMVLIGISTGGPRALQEVIPKLPASLSAPVVIVQHLPAGFTRTFAERLDTLSEMHVVEAEHGQILQAGCVYIAPGDRHIKIIKQSAHFVIQLDDTDRVNGHRPSADVLFDSVATLSTNRVVGIVMTGMGSDGAVGLKRLRDNGCRTLAQDENTCVVFGMPKVALQLGGAERAVALPHIAGEIVSIVEESTWT